MKIEKMFFLHCIFIFILNSACSKNDGPPNYEFSAEDFVANMDENPMTGDLIGLIQFGYDSGSQVRFSINSQSHENCMLVTFLGELYVDEASFFDFEANPILSASIKCENVLTVISDGGFTEQILATKIITATINLNDLEE